MNFGINIWFPGTESWIVAYLNFLLNAFQNQNGMYISWIPVKNFIHSLDETEEEEDNVS